MKIKFVNISVFLITLLSILSLNTIVLNAQEATPTAIQSETDLFNKDKEVEITDVQSLRAEFKQYTQDPSTKVIKFEMILTSQINSDRLRVTWNITGISKAVDDNQLTTVLDIKAGQTYVVPIEVIPTGYGISEVFGKAQAFGADSNVIATVRKNYASNKVGEILPITKDYKNKKIFNTIFGIVKLTGLILLVLVGVFFGFKKFTRWYNTNDVK